MLSSLPFTAYKGKQPYIFVSYSHQDSAMVFPIIRRYHDAGYPVWYDEGIDPGNEWPEEIAAALSGCSLFVVFISPRSNLSVNVRNEINFALADNIPFIAIHIEETDLVGGLKLQIGSKQAIMKYRMDDEAFYYKCETSFEKHALGHEGPGGNQPMQRETEASLSPSLQGKSDPDAESPPVDTHDAGIQGISAAEAGRSIPSAKEAGPLPAAKTIATGFLHTVAIKADGTVVATGDNSNGQCDVSDWRGISAVAAGFSHTVGLQTDGRVVAVGVNFAGECNVSGWQDIVAIAAGDHHTVGLKADGTVIATGENKSPTVKPEFVGKSVPIGTSVVSGYHIDGRCNLSDWRDIVMLAAGGAHTVGLKKDGTVVAAGHNDGGRCDVSDWRGIVAIAAGGGHTIGIRSDGTVIAAGYTQRSQCDVSDWREIMDVSANMFHTVGLKTDGTVVAAGGGGNGESDVSDWRGILAATTGGSHTVGLRADGTVIAAGYNNKGQCDVSGWRDLLVPEPVKMEKDQSAEAPPVGSAAQAFPNATTQFLSGNVANGHRVTKSGDWLFFSTENGIEKMREDGSGRSKISDHGRAQYLYPVGNWLYFVDHTQQLWKIDFDGAQQSRPYTGKVGSVHISGGWIYYQDRGGPMGGGSLHLMRMPLGGGSSEVVSTNYAAEIYASDDSVYYINLSQERDLYRVNPHGADERVVRCDCQMYGVNNGWIYYKDKAFHLYKLKTDGTDYSQFSFRDMCSFTMDDDHIFYFSRRQELRRMALDGSADTLLSKVPPVHQLCVVGGWVYCYHISGGALLRVKRDGSETQEMAAAMPRPAPPASAARVPSPSPPPSPSIAFADDAFESLSYTILRKYNGNDREVVIPSRYTQIFSSAFSGCVALEKVVVPQSVSRIDLAAFEHCVNLRSLVIEGKNVTLKSPNFNGCPNLTITCPRDSVTHGQVARAFDGPLELT